MIYIQSPRVTQKPFHFIEFSAIGCLNYARYRIFLEVKVWTYALGRLFIIAWPHLILYILEGGIMLYSPDGVKINSQK